MKTFLVTCFFTLISRQVSAQEANINNQVIVFADVKQSAGDKFKWQKSWNIYLADAIDKYGQVLLADEKLPKVQIERLCPHYFTATRNEKKAFWVLVFASIIKYESGFDPKSRFMEPAPLNVYSEGLLQLSYGDEKNFKGLPIDKAKSNILDPEINLTSGVIIMSKQISTKKTLFTAKHYYWSVLTNKQKEVTAYFSKSANSPNGLKCCR